MGQLSANTTPREAEETRPHLSVVGGKGTSLNDLAAGINADCRAIDGAEGDMQAAAVEMLARARCVGARLIEAKGKVPHGQWLPWVRENCVHSIRRCQQYMELARLPEVKCEPSSYLTIKVVLAESRARRAKAKRAAQAVENNARARAAVEKRLGRYLTVREESAAIRGRAGLPPLPEYGPDPQHVDPEPRFSGWVATVEFNDGVGGRERRRIVEDDCADSAAIERALGLGGGRG